MKYYLERKNYSWMDSYKLLDEDGTVRFTVTTILTGQLGHEHIVRDDRDWEIGRIKERVTSMKPYYDIVFGGKTVGRVKTDRTFIKKKLIFDINYMKWKISGNILEWDYQVSDQNKEIMTFGTVERNGEKWYCADISDDLPGDLSVKAVMLLCGIHLFNGSMNEDYQPED